MLSDRVWSNISFFLVQFFLSLSLSNALFLLRSNTETYNNNNNNNNLYRNFKLRISATEQIFRDYVMDEHKRPNEREHTIDGMNECRVNVYLAFPRRICIAPFIFRNSSLLFARWWWSVDDGGGQWPSGIRYSDWMPLTSTPENGI